MNKGLSSFCQLRVKIKKVLIRGWVGLATFSFSVLGDVLVIYRRMHTQPRDGKVPVPFFAFAVQSLNDFWPNDSGGCLSSEGQPL